MDGQHHREVNNEAVALLSLLELMKEQNGIRSILGMVA